MPIENDFLPFAVGSGANVEAQSTWVTDTVLQTGFQSGVANSAQANKVLRQASIIASMIAQFIVDNSGQPAIDNGTTATLETNFHAAITAIVTAFVANALGSGGTIYNPDFASVSTDAYDPTGSGQVRMTYGNYGVIFRNDGGTLWILLTNSGNANGTFNSLRPFSINLSTGAVSIDGTGVGTTFGGNISSPSATVSGNETVGGTVTAGALNVTGGATVAGPLTAEGGVTVTGTVTSGTVNTVNETVSGTLNAGTLAVTGYAYAATPPTGNRSTVLATTQCFANEFAASFSGLNGYQKLPTGLVIQWGSLGSQVNLGSSGTTFNFPIAFPNTVLTICSTDVGLAGNSSVHLTSCSAKSNSQFVMYATNAASGSAAATNVGWIAIGY
jgi:Long-tail fiber proximal subunit, C-terminal, trimerization domain/Putative tail fiber protein gp53-like, C-terminal